MGTSPVRRELRRLAELADIAEPDDLLPIPQIAHHVSHHVAQQFAQDHAPSPYLAELDILGADGSDYSFASLGQDAEPDAQPKFASLPELPAKIDCWNENGNGLDERQLAILLGEQDPLAGNQPLFASLPAKTIDCE